MNNTIIATSRNHLEDLIQYEIERHGYMCDLNHIDVSQLTDLNRMFEKSEYRSFDFYKFNGDISKWDVSNVTDMRMLFLGSEFNGDISNWNTSKVENMYSMFEESQFNGHISRWNVANVEMMNCMFFKSKFTGDLSSWQPFNAESIYDMFEKCSAPIPYWATIEDKEERSQAIEKYHHYHKMAKQLDSTLANKIKHKIKV